LSMLDDKTDTTAVIAATAASRTEGPYKAVMVKKTSGGLQLVWKTTDRAGTGGLGAFVGKVMPGAHAARDNGTAPTGVVGLDCAGVAFYRIELPAVADQKLDAIVRMQAESLLPLPSDQMRIAWRANRAENNKRACSIAAARSDRLRQVAADTSGRASMILLNAEAVVTAWRKLFDRVVPGAVLINIRANDTQVLLTSDGLLAHAVTLDIGEEELCGGDTAAELELFVHDLRNALELFASSGADITEILVISENAADRAAVVTYLREAGIDAAATMPSSKILRYGYQPDAPGGGGHADASPLGLPVTARDICEYLEPIGLALTVLEGDVAALNLFDGLLTGTGEKDKARVGSLFRWACVAAVTAAVVFAIAGKMLDKASLARFSTFEVARLIEQHNMKKLIAGQRPDILGAITAVSECGSGGMMLNSFGYKDGKITIAGFARSWEQMYEFQKNLEARKNIAAVSIISPSFDERAKRVNFKMQFQYRNPFRTK